MNESLIQEYIKNIENHQMFGFDQTQGVWRVPKEKGTDPNQIGYGLDLGNKYVQELLHDRILADDIYMTVDEEKDTRLRYTSDLYKILNKYVVAHFGKNVNDIPDRMSDKKVAIALGMMYHGFGPKLWKPGTKLYEAMWNGSDADFDNAVYDFYNGKYTDRAKCHKEFWESNPCTTKCVVSEDGSWKLGTNSNGLHLKKSNLSQRYENSKETDYKIEPADMSLIRRLGGVLPLRLGKRRLIKRREI